MLHVLLVALAYFRIKRTILKRSRTCEVCVVATQAGMDAPHEDQGRWKFLHLPASVCRGRCSFPFLDMDDKAMCSDHTRISAVRKIKH